MTSSDLLTLGLAQIAPVWLDRDATLDRVAGYITEAADAQCDLLTFGEALVPGYPFWLELTGGARFNDPAQKQMFAWYLDQGVVIERGDLDAIRALCAQRSIALYLGILFVAWQVIRRPRDSFGRLLAFGVACLVGFQALINIAVATVSVPTKGLSLPLVSAGGSGLVITCAALGVLYSVSRREHQMEVGSVNQAEAMRCDVSRSEPVIWISMGAGRPRLSTASTIPPD